MSSERILMPKSLAFAKRIVFAYRYLSEEKKEYVLSKQMLRSGTSIGANIAEAQYGSSRKDFLTVHCLEGMCGDSLLAGTALFLRLHFPH